MSKLIELMDAWIYAKSLEEEFDPVKNKLFHETIEFISEPEEELIELDFKTVPKDKNKDSIFMKIMEEKSKVREEAEFIDGLFEKSKLDWKKIKEKHQETQHRYALDLKI